MMTSRRRLGLLGLLGLLALCLSLGRPGPREPQRSSRQDAPVADVSRGGSASGADPGRERPPGIPPPKTARPKPGESPLDRLSGAILENRPGSPAPYVLRDRNATAFFDPQGILFALHGRPAPGAGPGEEVGQAIRWGLQGAAPTNPRPEQPLPARVHDYRGSASNWRPNTSTYGSVVYDDVRPGVDLVIEPRPKGVKYTLQAARAADLGELRFRYEGSGGARVLEGGAAVEISTSAGSLREDQLKVWQDGPEGRKDVQARYVQSEASEYRIELSGVDPALPITVDPVISWSTLMGGSVSPIGEDYGTAVAVSPLDGSTFVAGYTYAVDFPGATGSLQGTNDAFLVKIDPAGTSREWAVYLGGSSYDYAYGVTADASGNVYVTGVTGSVNFPTTPGVHDTTWSSYDTFVMKFSPGGVLNWSTLLGGSSSDYGQAIAIDGAGNVIVGGYTYSNNFPIVGGFDPSIGSTPDAYIAKLNPTGTTLLWSSFLGGNGSDQITGLALNAAGNIYVTGFTSSTDFPTNNGYYSFKGGTDGFLTKINVAGSSIDWSTYLGGANNDYSQGITLANDVADPDPVIVGYTTSTDFPTTPGALDTTYNLYEVFVTRFKADGSALVYSTFLGGTGYDYGTAIAAGAAGSVYVTGYTGSSNFPVSATPHRSTLLGGYDGFVTRLNAAGNAVMFSTFLGGTNYEYPRAIAVRSGSSVVIAGQTSSSAVSSPAPGLAPFDAVLGGTTDAFAAQLNLNLSTLNWANFIGGANSIGDDYGQGVAADGLGNVYVTGYTNASDYPSAIGVLDWQIGGTQDAFLSKLNTPVNSDVPTLVWSTYLGGSGTDWGYSVAVDPSNRAYVAGTTSSTDFPLLSAWDPTSSGYEAFLTRFNPDGTLSYSTFVGGSSTDYGRAVAVDSASNAYLTGYTYSSTGFPLLSAFDGTFGGGSDVFVTKFNSAGTGLWSSFLGGVGYENAFGIAADDLGNAYVIGYTDGTDLTASYGLPVIVPDATNGGSYDAFVARVNAGGSLAWVRYLGGLDYDYGNAIVINPAGTALYAVGYTFSTDFPILGGFDPTRNSYEGFVTRLNPANGDITWSTFLGGTSADYLTAAAVNAAGDVFVTGYTNSSNFPFKGAIDNTLAGSYDVFVTKIYADGSTYAWSTLLGGSALDYGQGIAVDATGVVYVTGYTTSTNFPTQNWLDNTMQGSQDAFLLRIKHANPDTPDFAAAGTGQFKQDGTTSLAVGAWSNQTSFFIKGRLTDSDDEDVRLEVEIQPVGADLDGTGTLLLSAAPGVRPGQIASVEYSFPVGPPAQYHWRARTVDSRGLTSAWLNFGANPDAPLPAARDVGYDNTAPVPLFTTPTAAGVYYTTASSIALEGTSSDVGSGVGSVSWFNNLPLPLGVGGGAVGTTAWSVGSVPLQEGANSITVSATDLAGKTGQVLLTIHRDNTDPLVSITTPASDPFATGASSVLLSGTASDAVLLSTVTWSNNRGGSGTCVISGGTWNISPNPPGLVTGLSPGLNVITVTATDAAGNTATDTVTINYDTTPPAVAFGTPAAGTVTQNSTIGVTGSASDNVALAGVNPVTWQNLTYPAYFGNATMGAGWSFTADLGAGANTIQVTATDSFGLTASTTRVFYRDMSAPLVDITSPDNSVTFNTGATSLSLSGNATDDIGVASIGWVYSGTGSFGTGSLTTPGATASGWSINLPPGTLITGTFTITVTATDVSGRTATDVISVFHDTNAPSVSVTTPAAALFVTNSPTLQLVGTAADDTNVTTFTVTNSPNLVPVVLALGQTLPATPITWTADVSLDPGTNTVTITAGDGISTTVVTVTIIYDPVAPVVKITGPTTADDYATGLGTISLAGTASDARGVTGVTWSNSLGGSGNATGTTNWSVASIPLFDGPQLITIMAADEAGNLTTDTLLVTYDVTLPDVQIMTPSVSATAYSFTNTVDISGIANDNILLGSITWSNAATGDSGTATGTTSWSATSITLDPGANLITVIATDTSGNLKADTITVYYDTQAPTVVITGPTGLATFRTNSATLVISGTASDDIGVSQVDWSNVELPGMAYVANGTAVGTTSWEETSVTLVPGDNLITVTVFDVLGNSNTTTLTVHYDDQPPSINITSPTALATASTTDTPLLLGGTASDLTGTLALVDASQVTWQNTTTGGSGVATLTGNTWSALIPLTSGVNSVQVFASDAAGNSASDLLTVTYDPAAPLVTIQGPTTDLTFTTGTTPVILSGIASDDVGVSSVTWSSNAAIIPAVGTAGGTPENWTVPIELAPGANLLTITAVDAVGRTGTSRITVIYDPTPPASSISTPSADSVVQSTAGTITLGGTASDNLQVDSVTWTNLATGESGTASGTGVWSVSNVSLVTGDNLITVTATDSVGNASSSTITVVYDGLAPTVAITAPAPPSFATTTRPLLISGTAADNLQLAGVTWTNNLGGGGTAATVGTATSVTWSAWVYLFSGSNDITVTAVDAHGFATSTLITIDFTPESLAPSIAITSPTATGAATSATQRVTIGGTADDNVSVVGVTWLNQTTMVRGTAVLAAPPPSLQPWSAEVPLADGSNVIVFTAVDDAGNTASAAIVVAYSSPADALTPSLLITGPTLADVWASSISPVSVTMTATDATGIASVTWVNSGTGGTGVASLVTGDIWTSPIPLALGANTIVFTARDAAGNTGNDTLIVNFLPPPGDSSAPFITITSHPTTSTAETSGSLFALSGTASDNAAVTGVVWSNAANGLSASADGTISWTASLLLVPGINILTMKAYDSSGNVDTDLLTVLYAPPPPPPEEQTAGAACGLLGIEALAVLGLLLFRRRRAT